MRPLHCSLFPRWAVPVALAAALAWQAIFVVSVYVATDGIGLIAVCGSPAPKPAPPALVELARAGMYPGSDLLGRVYESDVLLYPQILEWAAGVALPGISGWVPVLLVVVVNVQFWTLAMLAVLWVAESLGAAMRGLAAGGGVR